MIETQLQKGEHVEMVVRKHILILIAQLLPFIFLDYLPYLVPKVGMLFAQANPQSVIAFQTLFSFENPWFTFIVGIYWLFVWMGAFGVFINYFLDQWVITNKRLIDIDQRGFWDRDVAVLMMARVENVQVDTFGLLNTLFGFGTVNVETAGAELDRFKMSGLANSNHVRDVLLRVNEECRKREHSPEI